MPAIDLVKTLIADGVVFETNGETLRWRNAGDRITPEILAELGSQKASVISYLKANAAAASEPSTQAPPSSSESERASTGPNVLVRTNPPSRSRPVVYDPKEKPDDIEVYADTLRQHGPMSYGMAMSHLGWGGTRAGNAEAALRASGRIVLNKFGRAMIVIDGGKNG